MSNSTVFELLVDEELIQWLGRYHIIYENSWNSFPSAAFMRQWTRSALIQVMAGPLLGTKSLSKPMLGSCQLDP